VLLLSKPPILKWWSDKGPNKSGSKSGQHGLATSAMGTWQMRPQPTTYWGRPHTDGVCLYPSRHASALRSTLLEKLKYMNVRDLFGNRTDAFIKTVKVFSRTVRLQHFLPTAADTAIRAISEVGIRSYQLKHGQRSGMNCSHSPVTSSYHRLLSSLSVLNFKTQGHCSRLETGLRSRSR